MKTRMKILGVFVLFASSGLLYGQPGNRGILNSEPSDFLSVTPDLWRHQISPTRTDGVDSAQWYQYQWYHLYYWDEISGWDYHSTRRNDYDTGGRLLTNTAEDTVAQTFVSRTRRTLDAWNLVKEDVFERWESGAWVPQSGNKFAYNGQGKIVYQAAFRVENGVWDSTRLYYFQYDAWGNRTEDTRLSFLNGVWDKVSTTFEHVVDSLGRATTTTRYSYSPADSSYYLSGRTSDVEFDSSGNVLYALIQTWDSVSQSWKDVSRSNSVFGEFYFQQVRESFSNQSWILSDRTTYHYDSLGNFQVYLTERWNEPQQAWDTTNLFQYLYTYNPNGQILVEIGQEWDNGGWVNFNKYEYGGYFSYTGIAQKFPRIHLTSVQQGKQLVVKGDPQSYGPVEIALTAIDGRSVWQRAVKPEELQRGIMIPVHGFATGVYLLKAEYRQGFGSQKLLIKN